MSTLPLEVIEHILCDAWSAPLSAAERIALMTASALVSRAWASVFTHISFRDAHIPCPSYLPRFLRLTRIESLYTGTCAPRERICRSIHLTVANPHTHPTPDPVPLPAPSTGTGTSTRPPYTPAPPPLPMAAALSDLLFALSAAHAGFPRLRTLALSFRDLPFHAVLAHHRFFRFPGQVTRLELRFAFAPHTPPWLVAALRADQARRPCLYPFVPSVRELVVRGASDAFVADMVRTCRELETLEVDFPEEVLARAAKEPRLVRICEAPDELGEIGEAASPLRFVIADAYKEVWQGAKVDPASDVYKFHRRLQ